MSAKTEVTTQKTSMRQTRFSATFLSMRAKAGFFIWLKIPTCDRKFTKNLYDAHKILVMPGTFLARESFDMNPGLNYIRIALVHNQKKCIKGLEKSEITWSNNRGTKC